MTRPKDSHAPAVTYETATEKSSTAQQKYHIWTIGCQMNVADSNHVAAELEKIGYGPTDSLNDADVVVLNTCVVRQSAEDKAVGKLGSLKPWRRRHPKGTLALMPGKMEIEIGDPIDPTAYHPDQAQELMDRTQTAIAQKLDLTFGAFT